VRALIGGALQEIAKTLIFFGIIFIAVGALLFFFHKIPLLGKLPGDILIKKGNFTFYFPLVTCLLASIVISLILRLFK
jgi:hypothetical protein